MQNAYRELGNYFTLKETDLELRKLCPFMRVDVPVNDGWKLSRVIEFGEAGKNKQAEFINFIRILAATEFSVDIKDPGVKQTN